MNIFFDFEEPIIEINKRISELQKSSLTCKVDFSKQIIGLEKTRNDLQHKIYKSLTPWQRVQIARHCNRPHFLDYIRLMFKDFIELHGDRDFDDDQAIVCGIAHLDVSYVVVIGHQKGMNLEDNLRRHFGMAHPEGYKKALRVMKFAEKFNKPIITFIDTPGAYAGITAEMRGQARAIANNLLMMSSIKVPIISIVIGEGGSGGALGISISNRILCLENAYYSVISPEGCAAILFKDSSRAPEAAIAMKITAKDLFDLHVVDEIIKEPLGGAHYDPLKTANNIKLILNKHLQYYKSKSIQEILDDRYNKFRKFGIYSTIETDKLKQGGS
ncbi:MAG: acetyl-CoA carboxylase carboxyltransferase subunit alpha [Endomicrobium sp.]|jgi:acetyl-CoA carboxylase carboxyl transferase subunit alpha|nr:acetyl-CoA carboxylase carboxyltransferase subunit alpha [Endomicrobium sp.]